MSDSPTLKRRRPGNSDGTANDSDDKWTVPSYPINWNRMVNFHMDMEFNNNMANTLNSASASPLKRNPSVHLVPKSPVLSSTRHSTHIEKNNKSSFDKSGFRTAFPTRLERWKYNVSSSMATPSITIHPRNPASSKAAPTNQTQSPTAPPPGTFYWKTLSLALESNIPTEVSWAIDALVKLTRLYDIELIEAPGMLANLVSHSAVFEWQNSVRQNDHGTPLQRCCWHHDRKGAHAHKRYCPGSAYHDAYIMSRFDFIDVDDAQLDGRSLDIMQIIRNLACVESNALEIARVCVNETCFVTGLLCCSQNEYLKSDALFILSVVARGVDLRIMSCSMCVPPLLRLLWSDVKEVVLTAAECFAGLARRKDNQIAFANIEDSFYDRLLSMVMMRDSELARLAIDIIGHISLMDQVAFGRLCHRRTVKALFPLLSNPGRLPSHSPRLIARILNKLVTSNADCASYFAPYLEELTSLAMGGNRSCSSVIVELLDELVKTPIKEKVIENRIYLTKL